MFIPMNQDAEQETIPATTVSVPNIVQSNPLTVLNTNVQLKAHDVSPMQVDMQNRHGMDSRLAKVPQPPAKTNCSELAKCGSVVGQQNLSSTPQKATIPMARSIFQSNNRIDTLNTGVTRIVGTRRIVVQNNFQKPTSTTATAIHRVICFENKTTAINVQQQPALWQFVTGSAISNFNTSIRYIILGCVDGTVYFLDVKYGTLVLPVITMANLVVQSAFSLAEERDDEKDLAGIVTETGVVRIWDLRSSKTDLAVTCVDLLHVGCSAGAGSANVSGGGGGSSSGSQGSSLTAILMLAITPNGTPFIVLGNGTSYCYSRDLDSWLVLNGRDLLQQRALIRCAPAGSTDMKRFPLTSIQTTVLGMLSPALVRAAAVQGGVAGTGASEWEALAQLVFIENQLKLCMAIRSVEELRYWYSRLGYTMALGVGTEMRLRQLLDDLLGPVFATAEIHRKREILVS